MEWITLIAPALVLLLYVRVLGLPLARRILPDGADFALRFGLSTVLVFLFLFVFGWLRYLAGLSAWFNVLLPLAAIGLLLAGRRRGRLDSADRSPFKLAALAYMLTYIYGLLLAAQIGFPSGGGWSYDWQEHYLRAIYFLMNSRDYGFQFFIWSVPARPPVINIVAGHFLPLSGLDYAHYHAVTLALGSLTIPVALLLARRHASSSGPTVALVILALLLNPAFVQHLTYSWTRLPVALVTALGCYFYVLGLRDNSARYAITALGCLCLAVLGHYSAAPFALVLGLHFAFGCLRSDGLSGIKPLAIAAALILLLAAPWFAWSITHYGLGATLSATSTVGENADKTTLEILNQIFRNVYYTLVPFFIDGRHALGDSLGQVRDYFFFLFQSNLLFMPGSATLLVGILTLRQRFKAKTPEVRPWLVAVYLFLVIAFLSIATNDNAYSTGVAHISFLPVSLSLTVWVASQVPSLPSRWRIFWFSGLLFDSLAGIALHFFVQRNWHILPHADSIAQFFADSQYRFLHDAASPGFLVLLLAVFLILVLQLRKRLAD